MPARLRWARFRLATVFTLVLGIAIGLVCHQYAKLLRARLTPRRVTPTFFVSGALPAMELELARPMSVTEAIERAGGLGDLAGKYQVTILSRNGDGPQSTTIVDIRKPSGASSPIRAGDIVVVEELP